MIEEIEYINEKDDEEMELLSNIMSQKEQDQHDAEMKSIVDLMVQEEKERREINERELEYVKQHINYSIDMIEFEDLTYWKHIGYVEVEKSDYKSGGYPSYDFYVEKGNSKSLHYMRQDDDGEFHSMVWQTVGCCEDDYSGFMLYPLNNGKYWKISYEC